jgi:DNA-binding GntR family transcriptional regulator
MPSPILMTRGEMNYDDIEAAYSRRILGYREIIRARTPTRAEARACAVSDRHPLIEVRRCAAPQELVGSTPSTRFAQCPRIASRTRQR